MLDQSIHPEAGTRSESRPCARKDLRLEEVGSDGLLYDREAGMVHILNQTALYAWKKCDGSRTADAIARELEGAFSGCEVVDLARDVLHILQNFAEKGLLEPASHP